MLQEAKDLRQQGSKSRKRKRVIREAQRRQQAFLERDEKLSVQILVRAKLLEVPEQALKDPAATRRVLTDAEAIGALTIRDTTTAGAERKPELVGTESAHRVGKDGRHLARLRGRQLQDPQE